MSKVVMNTMVPLICKTRWNAQFSKGGGERLSRKRMNIIKMAATNYSSSVTTDILIPLSESPVAPLDQYLEDKQRVFNAIFPEKGKSQRLNEDEWRLQMVPIEVPMMTAWPVVDMRLRYKSGGVDYPPEVPQNITKIIQLDVIRWEIQGLDKILKTSDFALGVKGTLYPDKRGSKTRLKCQLQMSIGFVLPNVLTFVPDHILQDIADSMVTGLMGNMKHRVNKSLLVDYNKFKMEKLKTTD